MQDFWTEVRAGWQEAAWTSRFTRVALPGTLLVFLLAAMIEGRVTDPPSSLTWALEGVVLLAALTWAGLCDGPQGFLGRTVWRIAMVLVICYAISLFLISGAHEKQVVLRAAGYAFTVQVRALGTSESPGREAHGRRSYEIDQALVHA